jgi:hypothetical protein
VVAPPSSRSLSDVNANEDCSRTMISPSLVEHEMNQSGVSTHVQKQMQGPDRLQVFNLHRKHDMALRPERLPF